MGKRANLLAAQREMVEEQLGILQLQEEETALMRPYILSGMGLIEEGGELRYMTEEERMAGMSELELGQYGLTKASQERQAQAYAGELPISPALERNLTEQKKQIIEALSQRLGPNWMQTTPGQQAMSGFEERASLVREEARRGAITGEGGLLLGNLAYMGGARGQRTAEAYGFPSRTGGLLSGYGQVGAGYGQVYQGYQRISEAKGMRQAGLMGGMGSLIGAGIYGGLTYAGLTAGTAAPAAAAAASSKILKKNIEVMAFPIEKIEAIRGVGFDWKDGTGHDVGVIAEELEKVLPEAVVKVDGIKHVYYHKILPLLIEVAKEQQKQIDVLKKNVKFVMADLYPSKEVSNA